MTAPPSPTPEAWAQLDDYTRLVILHQRDTDTARKQAIATHLANIAPYAGAGADGPAAALITQHYAAEAEQLAGTPQPAPASDATLPEKS